MLQRTDLIYASVLMFFIFVILAITGCGTDDTVGTCVFDGCDKETEVVEGPPGRDGRSIIGPQGQPGTPGSSCTVTPTFVGAIVSCGDTSVEILNGTDGESIVGPSGTNGINGLSCEVDQLPTGAVINCLNSQAVVWNGEDDSNGIDAVVERIDPCGPNLTTAYNNELLLRFADGAILAWLQNVGIVEVLPGTWQTTDTQHCTFTVAADGEVTW